MSSVVKTLGVFSQERVIVERERSKGCYDVAPYFGAKLAAESPIGAVFPLLFGALLYPTTGLHPRLSRCFSCPAFLHANLQDASTSHAEHAAVSQRQALCA